MKERSAYFDAIKGVCICAVVAIHCLSFSDYQANGATYNFAIVLRQVINFPVAVFLGIAAYFYALSPEWTWGRLRNRLWSLALPYLIAAVVFIALRGPDKFLDVKYLIKSILSGDAIIVGYFVPVLLQLTLLTPLLLKIESQRTHLLLLIGGVFVSVIWTYGFQAWQAGSMFAKFPWNVVPFFVWFPFFQLGLYIGKFRKEILWQAHSGIILLTLGGALVASMIEAFIVWGNNWQMAATQVKLSSITTSLLLLSLIIVNQQTVRNTSFPRWLVFLGKQSYFIYLYHMIFVGIITSQLRDRIAVEPLVLLVSVVLIVTIVAVGSRLISTVFGAQAGKRLFGS